MKLALKTVVAAVATLALQAGALAAELRVAINQSPWLDGFSKTAQAFEKQTGHKVVLSITPYFGLLECWRRPKIDPLTAIVPIQI